MPGWLALIGFLAATLTTGAAGALFKPGTWYRTLEKPRWTPPNIAFPIAWTLLYILMAFAAWRVALTASAWTAPALALWCWQLVLNALWSPVFFGLHRVTAGLVVILALWLALALTTLAFFAVAPAAGWLMLPYLLWVSYAAALNFAIHRRNPEPV